MSEGVFNLVIKHELAVKPNVVWVHNLKCCVCGYTTCISGYKTYCSISLYCDMRYSVFLGADLTNLQTAEISGVGYF